MKISTKNTYFERRKQNVRSVDATINLLEKKIKNCIINAGFTSDNELKNEIENEIDLLTRLLAGAVIIWCEALIKALYYEYGAFEEEQIYELLSNKKTLEQKWTVALTCAFYKAFSGIPYNPLNPIPNKSIVINLSTISAIEKDKFEKLYELIETKLRPAIDIRNKIQHGDWDFSFKEAKFDKDSSGNRVLGQKPAFDRKLTMLVEKDNILSLRLKRNQFRLIYSLIKELAVFRRVGKFRPDNSQTPFEYNFGKRYNQIISNQIELENIDFEKYKADLVSVKARGKVWQEKQTKISFFSKVFNFFRKIYKSIKFK